MTIQVDLSRLIPAAAEKLVQAHVAKPQAEDLLFKVSKSVFRSCLRRRPKNAVKVSPEELRELNTFLGKSRRANDYAVWKEVPCSNCGKTLTFFDIFQSGRSRHGDDYVKKFLGGTEQHVHVLKRGGKMDVTCTKCSTRNVVILGYDGPEY